MNYKRRLAGLALSLTVAVGISGGITVQPALSKPDASNIQVSDEHLDNKPYQVASVIVKARPEQVWQVISDFRGAPTIFPTVKSCQVVADHGATKIVRYQMRPTGLLATFQYDLEVKEVPHHLMQWHRVSGDFKELDGYWKLEPAQCGTATLVTYASHVNGGVFMPQALVKRQFRLDLPAVMTALKNHAETAMNIASQTSHIPN